MGLFDVFTGAPAKKAAQQTRGYLEGVQNQTGGIIDTNLERGLGYAQGGLTGARNFLSDYSTQARGDIAGGLGSGIAALRGGTDQAAGAFGNQVSAYDPLQAAAGRYGQGSALYSDALGINGQGGTDRARSAFSTSPGYQFQVDQSLDAINRARNASGQLAGGNTDQSVLDRASGLANQEYGNYLNRLQGFQPLELQATSGAAAGQAAGYGNLGNLYGTQGAREADLFRGAGTSLVDISQRTGLTGAGMEAQGGQNLANLVQNASGLRTGLATSLAPQYAKTYSDAANAQLQGNKNLWDLGINAAKAAAGVPSFGSNFGGGGGGAGGFGGASGSPYAYGAGGYTGMGPFM